YKNGGDGSNLKIAAVDGAVGYKLTFEMLKLTYTAEAIFSTPETWYLIGGCIGDGSWHNTGIEDIGVSLFPLARTGGTTISYTGYFTTDGFKLIKTPGSWNDQWGQGSNGFVKNDGGSSDIKLPSAGYYTVTLDYLNDKLTVEPADIVDPKTYEVGMAGSFNSWSFQAMTKCNGTDHLWRFNLTAAENVEAKFLIDGWSVNWGGADFPTGIGTMNGPNIPVTAGEYIVVFNDITGGYNFIKTSEDVEPVSKPDTWYLVGGCIGDGSWANNSVDNVGTSLFPLAYSGENTISYTGYFTTDGFKLIKTPGSWDDQWGIKDGVYVKNDGGSSDIKLDAAGYYTVTLDTKSDQLTIVAADITPEPYEVGVAGSFNNWTFEAIEKCVGSEHLWRAEKTFDSAYELKFLIDGWSVNWGGSDFPSGIGLNGGPNIPVAAGTYIIVFNDITGGYNFISK
ncbi:MAG: SusF/SusE family outer membrane protein, partial [Muribaculaceae bacterium]|nr:SusF/SusE family outer membrane protein [Muribaculaceae bacterium]